MFRRAPSLALLSCSTWLQPCLLADEHETVRQIRARIETKSKQKPAPYQVTIPKTTVTYRHGPYPRWRLPHGFPAQT